MQRTATATEVLREEVESLLGVSITESVCARAYEHAKRKLARIIEREGDADGGRLQPYYITQLTAEAVREQSSSDFTIMLCEQIHREKEKPAAEAARQILIRNSIVSQVN